MKAWSTAQGGALHVHHCPCMRVPATTHLPQLQVGGPPLTAHQVEGQQAPHHLDVIPQRRCIRGCVVHLTPHQGMHATRHLKGSKAGKGGSCVFKGRDCRQLSTCRHSRGNRQHTKQYSTWVPASMGVHVKTNPSDAGIVYAISGPCQSQVSRLRAIAANQGPPAC
jgi:hypothetical protein